MQNYFLYIISNSVTSYKSESYNVIPAKTRKSNSFNFGLTSFFQNAIIFLRCLENDYQTNLSNTAKLHIFHPEMNEHGQGK